MNSTPTVSVLLPVYNAERFVAQSIQSILQQSFTDFELIILNDGSTDGSLKVIEQFNDERIRIVSHENMGLGATLNKGMEISKGKYIARQDADDISLPKRFEKQLDFLRKNPDVAVVGAHAQIIDEDGVLQARFQRHSCDSDSIKADLIFNNPFVHSSVLLNKEKVFSVAHYSSERGALEDFRLWSEVSRKFPLANLNEILVHYREVGAGISQTNEKYNDEVSAICASNLRFYSNEMSEESARKLSNAYHGFASVSDSEIRKMAGQIIQVIRSTLPAASEKLIDNLSARHIFHLKRKQYNLRIESEQSTATEKITARLKRKALFIFSPKQIHS